VLVVSVGMGWKKSCPISKLQKLKLSNKVFMSLRGWKKNVVSVVQHDEKRESILEKQC
jgi:hypothetical protein